MLQVVVEVGKAVGAEGLVAGQVVDIKSEGGNGKIGLETLQYIHEHKTAALLTASVVSGALLGGASEMEVQRLRKYSTCVGLAFQVAVFLHATKWNICMHKVEHLHANTGMGTLSRQITTDWKCFDSLLVIVPSTIPLAVNGLKRWVQQCRDAPLSKTLFSLRASAQSHWVFMFGLAACPGLL